MYSKLDDLDMMKKIRIYLSHHPNATRQEVCDNCFTNTRRLKMLEKEGYHGIPKPLPFGERNGLYSRNKKNERESINEVFISM